MKVCVVCSSGGHLTEVRELLPAYGRYPHFYVLNKRVEIPSDMEGKVYFIRHSERDLLFLVNLLEAWRILGRERPDAILSTGAGPAVPFALVGRFAFGIKVLFVETLARMERPSLTGRIMYWLADRFFYQCESLKTFFPKGIYGGSLL
jgi:UDP-N-acetylglucosamine:LPS N-acetylglucosamine transferase